MGKLRRIPGVAELRPSTILARPGWRNWSDAIGLNPIVLRGVWVRVPPRALLSWPTLRTIRPLQPSRARARRGRRRAGRRDRDPADRAAASTGRRTRAVRVRGARRRGVPPSRVDGGPRSDIARQGRARRAASRDELRAAGARPRCVSARTRRPPRLHARLRARSRRAPRRRGRRGPRPAATRSSPRARARAPTPATVPRTDAVGCAPPTSEISARPPLERDQVLALGRVALGLHDQLDGALQPRRRLEHPGARRKIAPTLTSSPGARRAPRPVIAPARERAEHGDQLARALGQLVVHARRHLAVALARQQAVGHHPVQPRAQLLGGDAR